ncbi:hypothetical protein A9K55_004963 [Cordyceps militaris]|uniref:Uncharacterized protein n=1 Tax=Cordyceps militaris TaxID=73501 RepID=A0A2H4SQ27_CORMI|nr:hypothetical protein A9K55_004963 [Cordyceps militaris]
MWRSYAGATKLWLVERSSPLPVFLTFSPVDFVSCLCCKFNNDCTHQQQLVVPTREPLIAKLPGPPLLLRPGFDALFNPDSHTTNAALL